MSGVRLDRAGTRGFALERSSPKGPTRGLSEEWQLGAHASRSVTCFSHHPEHRQRGLEFTRFRGMSLRAVQVQQEMAEVNDMDTFPVTPVGTREPLSALAGPPLDIPPTSLLMEETSWTPEHCRGRSGHGDVEIDLRRSGMPGQTCDSRAHPQGARRKQRARSHSASRDCQFSAFDRRRHTH